MIFLIMAIFLVYFKFWHDWNYINALFDLYFGYNSENMFITLIFIIALIICSFKLNYFCSLEYFLIAVVHLLLPSSTKCIAHLLIYYLHISDTCNMQLKCYYINTCTVQTLLLFWEDAHLTWTGEKYFFKMLLSLIRKMFLDSLNKTSCRNIFLIPFLQSFI